MHRQKASERWVAVMLWLVRPGVANFGAVHLVTTLEDSGPGSLREALVLANGHAGADTIRWSVSGTVTLQTALPMVTEDLTLEGLGSEQTEVNGGGKVRVFEFGPGKVYRLTGVTVRGGFVLGGDMGLGFSAREF